MLYSTPALPPPETLHGVWGTGTAGTVMETITWTNLVPYTGVPTAQPRARDEKNSGRLAMPLLDSSASSSSGTLERN